MKEFWSISKSRLITIWTHSHSNLRWLITKTTQMCQWIHNWRLRRPKKLGMGSWLSHQMKILSKSLTYLRSTARSLSKCFQPTLKLWQSLLQVMPQSCIGWVQEWGRSLASWRRAWEYIVSKILKSGRSSLITKVSVSARGNLKLWYYYPAPHPS